MISLGMIEVICGSAPAQAVECYVAERQRLPSYTVHPPCRERASNDCRRWSQAIACARKFDSTEFIETRHDNRIVLMHPDGHRVRTYFPSGALEYRDLRRAYAGSTCVDTLGEAQKIAEAFLGQYALWPLDSVSQLRPVDLSFVSSQGTSSRRDRTEIVRCNAILRYHRETDGVAWIGPGAYLTCIIEGTDVVGYEHVWRPITQGAESENDLLGLRDALGRAGDYCMNSLFAYEGSANQLTVEKIDFGYYAADKWTRQTILVPAYRLEVSVRGQVAAAVTQIVPASNDQRLDTLLPRSDHRPVAATRRTIEAPSKLKPTKGRQK